VFGRGIGVQVTILKKSELQSNNATYRIDAEYFKFEYLDAIELIEKCRHSYIEDVASWVTQGPNPIFSTVGTPCLTGRNINKGEVSYNNSDHVSDKEYEKLSRFQLKLGDTLITLKGKGSIGKIGYVIDNKHAIFSRDIGIVRPSKINSGYLNVFILCKYGKLLVDRGETGGTGQSTLTTSYLKSMPIPRFQIEENIGSILDKVEQLRKKSKENYQEAQAILLSELGLTNWQPKHQLTFVKSYSDTEQAGRIDAEYYQLKYEEIIETIQNYSGGLDTLGNLVTVKKCVEVGSGEYTDEGIPFIRVSNLSPFEITEEKYISESLYQEIKQHQPEKGEILFSKDATPGIAYYLNETPQKMIPSGGILRLKLKSGKINNEYLTLVLNSMLTKEQINRDVGGSVILHWRPDQVKETAIPILPEDKQLEIQQKVAESFNLRKQSKHLLECAKRAVEIAIEQDEQTAMQWLEEQISKAL
jgi:restriction endonuclease S subunit